MWAWIIKQLASFAFSQWLSGKWQDWKKKQSVKEIGDELDKREDK